MWRDYAASIGTTVDKLTKAQKIQAEVNGILEESRYQVGDAARYSNTYAGKLAMLSQSFLNLKVAVGNSIIPIISAILPPITAAVNWSTVLFNKVARIMSLLFGTTMDASASAAGMEQVAAGANDAASAQDGLAKSTKEAGKAAKGALAPFDELNVLQQDTENEGGGGVGGLNMAAIPLPPLDTTEPDKSLGLLEEKILAFKQKLIDFFAPFKEPLNRIWDAFVRIGAAIGKAVKSIAEDLSPIFVWFRDNVLLPILNLLATIFEKIAEWMEKNPEKVKGLVVAVGLLGLALLLILSPAAQVIAIIMLIITVVGLLIKYWPELKKAAIETFQMIKTGVINLWNSITTIWGNIGTWFQTKVIDPLVKAWDTATKAIGKFFTNIFDGSKLTVKTKLNSIILAINNFLSGAVGGINALILSMNKIPGINIQTLTVPQIPYLAKGAVIPPNAEFLAMLGDQRSGRNIEAPEDLIRQIVREETAGMGAGQEITINFAGSLGALVRELKPYIDKANIRTGKSLINGVTS
jgi:hypothetical protein